MRTIAIQDQEFFLLNVANHGFITGHASEPTLPEAKKAERWGLLVVAGFLFLGALGAAGSAIDDLWLRNRLADGTATVGTVLAKRRDDSGETTEYYVRYQFRVQKTQKTVTNERQVPRGTYLGLRVGERVDVLYASDDPTVSKISHDLPAWPWKQGGFALGLGVAGLGAFQWSRVRAEKLRQLAAQGKVRAGVLLEAKGETDAENDYIITLRYRFQTAEGRSFEDTYRQTSETLRNDPLPKPGTPVAVLFVDEKNYVML